MPYQAPQLRATLQAKDSLGLQPALDRRIVDKPFVMDGRNFLFNVQGPYSGFGRRKIALDRIADAAGVQAFEVGSGAGFVFTRQGILQFDYASNTFVTVWPFTTPVTPGYGWTHCFIAGRDYFCAKGPGLFEYNPDTNSWRHMTSIYYSDRIVAIAECRGRLIVLDEFSYNWSALEDPDDMEPSLTTGAGIQSLAIISGTAYKTVGLDDCFLVFTSEGIVIAEFSGGQAVFRHRVLSSVFRAINPMCIALIQDDSILFVDKTGFYTTDGKKPTIFDPVFSEYLSQTLIKSRDPSNLNAFRLMVDITTKLLLLSVSSTVSEDLFEMAWVNYMPKQQWGTYNEYHYGFINFIYTTDATNITAFSVVSKEGYIERITGENFIDGTTLGDTGVFYRSSLDTVTFYADNAWHFQTHVEFVDYYKPWEFEGFGTGWYTINTSTDSVLEEYDPLEETSGAGIFRTYVDGYANFGIEGPEVIPIQQNTLNAYILLGMFRYAELKFDDEMGLVTQMSVWSDPAGSDVVEDWATMPDITEDWNLIDGQEDWGFGVSSSDDFTTTLIGTLDGFNSFKEQLLINLDTALGYINRYPADVSGIFHMTKLEALAMGQTFHLKSLEMSGTSAGRLK